MHLLARSIVDFVDSAISIGEQGWVSGESPRLRPMWPEYNFRIGVICGLNLLLVLFSAPRDFSSGTPVLPFPQKPTFPNSNSSLESVPN